MDSAVNASERTWEKCARRLMMNSVSQLEGLTATVTRILGNIGAHPNDPKYRSLRCGNPSIKSQILDVAGGLELLQAVGFEMSSTEGGEKALVLSASDTGNFQDVLSWLSNTVETCKGFARARGGVADTGICAECTVQVRLPTGATAAGGFMRGDQLRHVRDFAACYFTEDRASAVKVVLPDSRPELYEALLDVTLEELGMCPRAVVIASVLSAQEREQRLATQFVREEAAQQHKVAQVRVQKKSTADARRSLQEERAKILAAFKDDHGPS